MPDQGVTLNARIQYKKDTDANWTSNNPVLLENELIIVEMENGECRFKIGDGTHLYVELPFISLGFSGVLDISKGGTGGVSITDARYNLHVPAEVTFDNVSEFPFSFGILCAKSDLGNTVGQATADNYYWGVDSTATLWGGAQINGATSPIWKRAMMMDGSQSFVNIFTGVLTSGSATVNDNGPKCAAWMIGAIPDPVTEAMVVQCVPGGIYEGRIYSGDRWIQFRIESQNKTIIIQSSSHGGSIEVIWGLLKHTP